ncbi:MAG: porin [Nitrospirales bacterium]|nr:porin [Nitrospira sp.]MDR4500251.1 porin [Nitrospirales bacterium]
MVIRPAFKYVMGFICCVSMMTAQLSFAEEVFSGEQSSSADSVDSGERWLNGQEWFQPDANGVVHVWPQDSLFRIRGWIDGGYTYNTDSPSSAFNGPYNAIDRDIAQLNQLYFILESPLRRVSGEWSLGGRVDFLWGYDYYLAESKGFERDENGTPGWNQGQYGVVLPQMYAEVGFRDVSLKLGHFYTIIGYEGVPALSNFFYSKSYSYQFAGPFTHWGGLMDWRPSSEWSFKAGVHNGWDTLKRNRKNRPGGLFGVDYTPVSDLWSLGAALTTGSEPSANPRSVGNRTRYSVIFKLRPVRPIEYVLHHHYAFQKNGQASGRTAQWYGIDQYLFYQVTERVKGGVRFEWLRDDDGTRVSGSPFRGNVNVGSFKGNFYSLSFGVNYAPHPNVLLRPEVRHDWFTGNQRPFDDGQEKNQTLLAINGLIQF